MKIESKSLMVGDWVERFGKKFQIKAHQFTECNFEAIPLTAEILEKNGWKLRQDYPTEYEYIEGEYAHCYYDVKHKHCIIEIWDELTIDILIDCVHQLLHCLRLCGLETLADNFQI